MRLRVIEFAAANAEQARQLASEQLEVPPEAITVTDAGNGLFHAEPENCDAEIELDVAEDMMAATLSGLPAKGKGRPISVAGIERALVNAGVRVPPDAERIKQVVRDMADGRDIPNAVIARGIAPQRATDARIETKSDWNLPIFPGDSLGSLVPAQGARFGITLDGKKIPFEGKDKGRDIVFPEEAHCHIDKVSLAIRSETYGLVLLDDQEVSVKPLIHVSPDVMRVTATIYASDHMGRPITHERMLDAMAALNVSEPLDGNAFASALAEAQQTGEPVKDVLICRGIKPKNGQDGWFDMLYEDDRSEVGLSTDGDRIDFRARGVVKSVQQDTLLGRLIPPTPGTPGRDVFSRIIPARDGIPFLLNVGDNIVTSEDGTELRAADNGMVFFIDNNLAVTEVFTTKGDVDYSIGNLSLEKGSVHVRGSVLSGFSVECPNNILVDEVIESAIVKAGGDIEVRGGIIMDRGGKISTQGGVSALFCKNAVIEAQGDVNIAHETNNSIIFARKKFIARRGRGKIVGSTIRAGEGIIANEIGSEMGVETTLHLGMERETDEEKYARKKKLDFMLQKIFTAIGKGSPKDILLKAIPEKRAAVAELLKARIRCEHELAEIEASIEKEREEMRKAMNSTIKVFVKMHPGVIINFFGTVTRVSKPIPRSTLYFNPGSGKLEVGKL
ncbi:MAG: FapA family protein [Desulfovibrionaceae bacterium]